jgi:hypothetical protein
MGDQLIPRPPPPQDNTENHKAATLYTLTYRWENFRVSAEVPIILSLFVVFLRLTRLFLDFALK